MPFLPLPPHEIFFSHRNHDADQNLILIHGAGGHHRLWPKEMKQLRDFNVYAPDLPGHGRSRGHGFDSIDAYANVLQDFAAKLDLKRIALCGHSMGGAIALTLAARKLRGLQKLILISTGAKLPVHPKILAEIRNDYTAAVSRIVRGVYGPHVPEALKQEAKNDLLKMRPQTLHNDFSACHAFDLTLSLAAIEVPTLILAGDDDPMTPLSYATTLSNHLPHATLEVIPQAGHMPFLEKTETCIRKILAFTQTPSKL